MKKLIMATNNANKLREAREIVAPLGIEVLSLGDMGIDCDPDENGETFADNAAIKARAVRAAVPKKQAGARQYSLMTAVCAWTLSAEDREYTLRGMLQRDRNVQSCSVK